MKSAVIELNKHSLPKEVENDGIHDSERESVLLVEQRPQEDGAGSSVIHLRNFQDGCRRV